MSIDIVQSNTYNKSITSLYQYNMVYNTTVTQKGQIMLRKELRDLLGIETNSRVSVSRENDKIIVKRVPDFLSFAGKFPITRGKSVLEAREYMEKHYKRV